MKNFLGFKLQYNYGRARTPEAKTSRRVWTPCVHWCLGVREKNFISASTCIPVTHVYSMYWNIYSYIRYLYDT